MKNYTYTLVIVEHVDHIFYCSSKAKAREIQHALEYGEAEPEDFPDEYIPEAGKASFDINSTNITSVPCL